MADPTLRADLKVREVHFYDELILESEEDASPPYSSVINKRSVWSCRDRHILAYYVYPS